VDEIRAAVSQTPQVEDVTDVRVRWLGHRLIAELDVAVSPQLSVGEGHEIAVAVEQQLLEKLRYLSRATIHVDPTNQSGAEHHHLTEHSHGGETAHSHQTFWEVCSTKLFNGHSITDCLSLLAQLRCSFTAASSRFVRR
jgi:hypothetical protein